MPEQQPESASVPPDKRKDADNAERRRLDAIRTDANQPESDRVGIEDRPMRDEIANDETVDNADANTQPAQEQLPPDQRNAAGTIDEHNNTSAVNSGETAGAITVAETTAEAPSQSTGSNETGVDETGVEGQTVAEGVAADGPPTGPRPLLRLAYRLADIHQHVTQPTASTSPTEARLEQEQRTLPQRQQAISTLLHSAHKQLSSTTEEAIAVSYAAEWLLDNFYVVEQALRQVKQDLPQQYYEELPRLAPTVTEVLAQPTPPVQTEATADNAVDEQKDNDEAAVPTPESVAPQATQAEAIEAEIAMLVGYPRIYSLVRGFLRHEEFNVNPERLTRFISAYQERTQLTMGEVWAIPIMLRFVLLESTAHAAGHITRLQEVAEQSGEPLSAPLRRELAGHRNVAMRLDDQDIVSSAIPSLRLLDTYNWKRFFEENSLVHQQLVQDPAGIYAEMDFVSRDRYRSAIEQLTKGTDQTEVAVTAAAISLAKEGLAHSGQAANGSTTADSARTPSSSAVQVAREAHVGYYLLGRGRQALEAQIGYHATGTTRLREWVLAHPALSYLSSITLLSLLLLIVPLLYAAAQAAEPQTLLGIFLLSLIPATTIAVNAINWAVTHLLPPTLLPKLNFEEGIPSRCASMIVIPALINSNEDIDSLLQQLEQHYLRNPDPNLRFALLSDFPDADAQELTSDAALIAHARTRLSDLNSRHTHQPFYFLHRQRLWNEHEGTWMGWERKRGKLHEFNRLLRGADNTSYHVQLGALDELPTIRYVITLDADTILPRDGAQRLIGTLAHPLNRARFDVQSGKVIDGYTVLQPRTAIQPTSANRSLFTRVFAGDVGLDLYTLAVSDVYQDLFGEGIFVGKGIYDVDAFERSLANRVPENALLSHDLFEGIHGRAGLVTDIVLYEDYPPNYLVNLVRSHRWVRGDWQLLPWLLPVTPRSRGLAPNDLSLLGRWKILDNLRRSILAPALLLLFLAGWTVLPGAPLFWTILAMLTPAFSLLAGVVMGIGAAVGGTSGTMWERFFQPVRNNALRWLLFIAFLPHESLLILDAVARTLVRVFITRQKLLEWTTAARAVRLFGSNVTVETTLWRMLPSILFVAVLALLVNLVNPAALAVSAPFFLVWL
ncbi:MAG: hypothetical protein KDE19_03970, partial [Caldilineaceae bacterium]|nr:hypothetical protein [Caldilineaceae bacterium]